MHLRRGHDIGTEVNEQVVIDQHRRAFSQTRTPKCSGPLAINALAKGFWKSVGGGGPEKCDYHLRLSYVLLHCIGVLVRRSQAALRACLRQAIGRFGSVRGGRARLRFVLAMRLMIVFARSKKTLG